MGEAAFGQGERESGDGEFAGGRLGTGTLHELGSGPRFLLQCHGHWYFLVEVRGMARYSEGDENAILPSTSGGRADGPHCGHLGNWAFGAGAVE